MMSDAHRLSIGRGGCSNRFSSFQRNHAHLTTLTTMRMSAAMLVVAAVMLLQLPVQASAVETATASSPIVEQSTTLTTTAENSESPLSPANTQISVDEVKSNSSEIANNGDKPANHDVPIAMSPLASNQDEDNDIYPAIDQGVIKEVKIAPDFEESNSKLRKELEGDLEETIRSSVKNEIEMEQMPPVEKKVPHNADLYSSRESLREHRSLDEESESEQKSNALSKAETDPLEVTGPGQEIQSIEDQDNNKQNSSASSSSENSSFQSGNSVSDSSLVSEDKENYENAIDKEEQQSQTEEVVTREEKKPEAEHAENADSNPQEEKNNEIDVEGNNEIKESIDENSQVAKKEPLEQEVKDESPDNAEDSVIAAEEPPKVEQEVKDDSPDNAEDSVIAAEEPPKVEQEVKDESPDSAEDSVPSVAAEEPSKVELHTEANAIPNADAGNPLKKESIGLTEISPPSANTGSLDVLLDESLASTETPTEVVDEAIENLPELNVTMYETTVSPIGDEHNIIKKPEAVLDINQEGPEGEEIVEEGREVIEASTITPDEANSTDTTPVANEVEEDTQNEAVPEEDVPSGNEGATDDAEDTIMPSEDVQDGVPITEVTPAEVESRTELPQVSSAPIDDESVSTKGSRSVHTKAIEPVATLSDSIPPRNSGQTFNDILAEETSAVKNSGAERSAIIIALCSGVAILFIMISVAIFLVSYQRQRGTLDIEMQEQRCGKDDLDDDNTETHTKLLDIDLPRSVSASAAEETDKCL